MKKSFIVILMVLTLLSTVALSGCSDNVSSGDEAVGPALDSQAIMGHWLKVIENDRGTIRDLKDEKFYYLKITENLISFYFASDNPDEGYSVSDKYYVLKGAECFYDYEEINEENYKDAIGSLYGGHFYLSFDDEGRLVIESYYDGDNKDGGYSISTYEKVSAAEWPFEEE